MNRLRGWLANILLLLVSMLVGFFIIEAGLRLLPKSIFFYNPHGLLIMPEGTQFPYISYKRNKDITMRMPHGNLIPMDRHCDRDIIEERDVTFKTDRMGLRNNSEYQNERFILLGDSFVVGDGTTQSHILSSQLEDKYGLDVYNLAMCGGFPEYIKLLKHFKKRYKSDFKILLFVFEGNDFTTFLPESAPLNGPPNTRERLRLFFRQWYIARLAYSAYNQILYITERGRERRGKVNVFKLKDGYIKIGFYSKCIEESREPAGSGGGLLSKALNILNNDNNIEHIFFIPTKYRVYHSLLIKDSNEPLPHSHWSLLKETSDALNIKCTDLTPYLIDESKRLIDEGKFTYWRDDTHWNRYGISRAAEVVYETIN